MEYNVNHMSIGPYLHSLEVSRLSKCSSEIQKDDQTFGIDCVKKHLEFQQVVVMYPTAIQQLKTEAALRNPNVRHSDMLIITNATILTMESGSSADEALVTNGVLVTSGGVIEGITTMQELVAPDGATVINAEGGK